MKVAVTNIFDNNGVVEEIQITIFNDDTETTFILPPNIKIDLSHLDVTDICIG